MTCFRIDDNGLSCQPSEHDGLYRYDEEGIKVLVVGHLRFERAAADEFIREIIVADDADQVVDRMQRSLSGEYAVVVDTPLSSIIYIGYSSPQFYVIKQKNCHERQEVILSSREADVIQGSVSPDRAYLRCISHHSFYIPRGVGAEVSDFIVGGMCLVYDKEKSISYQRWFFPVESVAARSDHDALVNDICDELVKEMAALGHTPEGTPLTLQLSSGLDSALLLAAAVEAGVCVQPVNFCTAYRAEEQFGARKMARYFGLEATCVYRGPSRGRERFTCQTDITPYLEFSESVLYQGSGIFILDNLSFLAGYKFGFHTSIEGSSYPTQLCLSHDTAYPAVNWRKGDFFPVFNPAENSASRYRYSVECANELMSIYGERFNDPWGVAERWPTIHPFYYPYLHYCFTQVPGLAPEISAKKIVLMPDERNIDVVRECVRANGIEIIEKVLVHHGIREALKYPDPEIAVRLSKIVSLILNASWAQTRQKNYEFGGVMRQVRPGIGNGMLHKLQSARIDKTLTAYPKWHLFEAFRRLSGRDFFSLQRGTPTKKFAANVKYKLQSSSSDPKEFMRYNRSVSRFFGDRGVIDAYQSIEEKMSDRQSEQIASSVQRQDKKSKSLYWYDNNRVNIGYLCNKG